MAVKNKSALFILFIFYSFISDIISNCHYQDTDRLWCIGLCPVVITKASQTMSYLH